MNCTFTTSCLEPLIGPVLAKLGTKHPFVKGIQVCLNKVLFQCEMIAKKKKIFSKTAGSLSSKICIKHLLAKKIQVFLNDEPLPLSKGT